ncbi:hypothetical protein [Eubacterium sp.]|uniref:hypothetical protein n=1 Tax=Eubacterium sp. TaxID=142586 RepID=UPI0025D1A32F|nr:hypothetical protein [Eubacterium sp.]MCR5630050.1 hypothetical protein [Eubacterium sp.]
MKKSVTIKEILIEKTIGLLLLTEYYWMFSRSDWKKSYPKIQDWLGWFFIVFFIIMTSRIRKYKKEHVDELAEKNLKRCDSICYKLIFFVMIITAFYAGIAGHLKGFKGSTIGWIIMISLIAISLLKTIMFTIMDSKGV